MLESLLRIAFRNLRRNLRRTLITALGLSLGTYMIVFSRGLVNGLGDGLVHGVTETRLGDLQLHRTGYLEAATAMPLQESFVLDKALQAVLAADPRITRTSGRVHFSGMVSVGDFNSLFFGLGIDPVGEYEICQFQRENILLGEPTHPDHPTRVVVGKPLADALGLTLGSELTVLANAQDGGLSGMDLTVGGIIEYKLPGPGSRIIQMPLATAQRLLRMPDQLTELIMNVEPLEEVEPVRDVLRERLRAAGMGERLEAHAWTDLGKQYLHMMQEQEYILQYIVVTLYITMISGIVNTMMMSVFERTQEIGTMMAVGVRRRRILLLIVLEATLLGVLGSLIGVLLGYAVVSGFGVVGFPLPPLGQATRWFYVYPRMTPEYALWVLGVALVCGLVAALYPAWRAARMRPAEALHAPLG